MPIRGRNPDCVRIVVGERGRVPMCAEVIWRFGYGAIVPWVRKLGDGALRAIAGPDMVVLRTPVHLRGENLTTVGEFIVSEGDRVPFVMSYGPSHLPVPEAFSADAALKDTESFWQEWCGKGQIDGPWKEAVTRSLITLKALTYGPTGGLVAAPTTSLPEFIGGNRNWDYRYLLAARCDADAARADERRLLRRSAALARLADARGRRKARAVARDVRRGGRAAPDRMGSGLAARLRAVAPGAHRQRGARPASARRLRRGHGHPAPGPVRRIIRKRSRLGRADRVTRSSRQGLARARSWHLGSAHRADALHLLQGHVLGGVRPRAEKRRDVRPARSDRDLAQAVR